jgi:hypothetical protein
VKRLLLILLVALVAVCLGGWKWGGNGHRTAGWTWDDTTSVYTWLDPTPGSYTLDDRPS